MGFIHALHNLRMAMGLDTFERPECGGGGGGARKTEREALKQESYVLLRFLSTPRYYFPTLGSYLSSAVLGHQARQTTKESGDAVWDSSDKLRFGYSVSRRRTFNPHFTHKYIYFATCRHPGAFVLCNALDETAAAGQVTGPPYVPGKPGVWHEGQTRAASVRSPTSITFPPLPPSRPHCLVVSASIVYPNVGSDMRLSRGTHYR